MFWGVWPRYWYRDTPAKSPLRLTWPKEERSSEGMLMGVSGDCARTRSMRARGRDESSRDNFRRFIGILNGRESERGYVDSRVYTKR